MKIDIYCYDNKNCDNRDKIEVLWGIFEECLFIFEKYF